MIERETRQRKPEDEADGQKWQTKLIDEASSQNRWTNQEKQIDHEAKKGTFSL